MVADANELDDLHWLKSMASKELDEKAKNRNFKSCSILR